MAFLTLLLLPLARAVLESVTLPTEIEPLGATDAFDFLKQADRHEKHDKHEHEQHEDARVRSLRRQRSTGGIAFGHLGFPPLVASRL